MVYVDLNPIRAGIATTPEASAFTSIYSRIQSVRRALEGAGTDEAANPVTRSPALLKFRDEPAAELQNSIPFRLQDYLALVDWTGRAVREDKRGSIDPQLPSIARRLNINPDAWCLAMQPRGNVFGRALGQLDHMRLHARSLGQSWVRGLRQAERLYRHS